MARLVENPDLAFRLARAIVSDIALYNQEKVKDGIKNDNIFELLTEELQEGREHFYTRVSPDIPDRRSSVRPCHCRCHDQTGGQDRKSYLVDGAQFTGLPSRRAAPPSGSTAFSPTACRS